MPTLRIRMCESMLYPPRFNLLSSGKLSEQDIACIEKLISVLKEEKITFAEAHKCLERTKERLEEMANYLHL